MAAIMRRQPNKTSCLDYGNAVVSVPVRVNFSIRLQASPMLQHNERQDHDRGDYKAQRHK